MATQNYRTAYAGIYIQRELTDGARTQRDHYWIMDDNGGEEHVGITFPSSERVDAYRNRVCDFADARKGGAE